MQSAIGSAMYEGCGHLVSFHEFLALVRKSIYSFEIDNFRVDAYDEFKELMVNQVKAVKARGVIDLDAKRGVNYELSFLKQIMAFPMKR